MPADDLEAWVLAQLKPIVLGDHEGVDQAVDRFVETQRRAHRNEDVSPLEQALASIDGEVKSLVTGLDPANLPLINDHLTRLRRRQEELKRQLRCAKAQEAHSDEAALRRWAHERLSLFAEIVSGRRDERARQALASYVDEVVIDPATKTGWLALNAGVGPEAGDTGADNAPQNANDRPEGRSLVAAIEDG